MLLGFATCLAHWQCSVHSLAQIKLDGWQSPGLKLILSTGGHQNSADASTTRSTMSR